mgnify:CR=1 FL=1
MRIFPAHASPFSPPLKIQNGSLVIIHRPDSESRELLIHFHGAAATVRDAHARLELPAVLAVVNFPGLSSAYSQPVARDPQLFDQILRHAWESSRGEGRDPSEPEWERVTLSSFSAGYGAVREILKTPANFERIDAIVAADSIYASLVAEEPERKVDPDQMRDFLRFARLACDGRKSFVISHSSQPTPYASTTDTADHLLRELGLERQPAAPLADEDFYPTTRAARGRFLVLGYAGREADDHLRHLRRIDRIWQELPENLPASR